MKNIGIWLDKEKAFILVLKEGSERLIEVQSELEFYHPKGGSRSKTRWGPQDVVQDSKYMEREKHQLRRYFQAIVEKIKDADALVIYGPAETYERLLKELQERHPRLAEKVKDVKRADSMTLNQVKALIRDYFIPLERY